MSPKDIYFENTANTIIKNFEKRGIEGYYFSTSKEAVEKALSFMPQNSTAAWGGSMTLVETGLMDSLKASEHTLIDRMLAKTVEEKKETYAKTVLADFYFMSSNAITLDGELINIDGIGNRTACLICGPENVIILAGMNKIVPDIKSGYERVKNMAAPPNAVRLNIKTPCGTTGRCSSCFSPDCMCCEIVITRKSRIPNRIKVLLIGETLGY